MEKEKQFLVGIFDDDDILIKATKALRADGVKIYEAYTPFPVHGLESALGYKRSFLPKVAFFFGFLGLSLGLLMQFWMMGVDWPMIIGGKDFAPLPTFIPVTFELTVLIAALGMVGVFMVSNDLKPHRKPKIFDPRGTDDKHLLVIDQSDNSSITKQELEKILTTNGAVEVNEKIYE